MRENPGPGSYELDIQRKIKATEVNYATRYKEHQFGAKVPRFSEAKAPVITDQQLRENELVMDMSDHVR